MDSEKEINVTSGAASAEAIGSVACSSLAVSADRVTELADVSTDSAPVEGLRMPLSKTVQNVGGNWQTKRPVVSKTIAKSQRVRARPTARKCRLTVDKGVQFETCLSSLSVRKLLLDIKNTVATIGRACAKMQPKPVENKAAVGVGSQETEVRFNNLLKTVNLTQLLLSCNGLIALQSHQDLLFCRVCQTRCEKAAFSPSCSGDQFGLFRHCLGKGYDDFSKPSPSFRVLRRDIWTHLNCSRHIHRLETWFMQNQANCQTDHPTGFICAGEAIMGRAGNNLYIHRNPDRSIRPANQVEGASFGAPQDLVAKTTTVSELTAPTASELTTPDTSTPTTSAISEPTTSIASQSSATAAGVSAMASTCSSRTVMPICFTLENEQNTNVTAPSNRRAESTTDVEETAAVFETLDNGDEKLAVSNLSAIGASHGLKVQEACSNMESLEDPALAATEREKYIGECESDRGFDTFEPVSKCQTVSLEYRCSSNKAVVKSGDVVIESRSVSPMTTKNARRVYICRPRDDGKLVGKKIVPVVRRKVESGMAAANPRTAVSTPHDTYSDVISAVATNTAGSNRSCVPEAAEPSSVTAPLVSSPWQSSASSSVLRQQAVGLLDPDIRVKFEPENQDEIHQGTGTFMVLDCPETHSREDALPCERSTFSVSSHRSDVAGDRLEDLCTLIKEEPVVTDTEAHGEEEISRPATASVCTVRLAYMQNALFQHLLPAGHSQSSVIMPESNCEVLSTPTDRSITNGRRIVGIRSMKTQTPRVRKLSYVKVPTKSSSSDADGCIKNQETCGPSKRTRTSVQTDHLRKQPKTDRNM